MHNIENGIRIETDIVIGMDKLMKDILKALINDDFAEYEHEVDLSKWHWHANFEDLDSRNMKGDSVVNTDKKSNVEGVNSNGVMNSENNDQTTSVFNRGKMLLMKNNRNYGFHIVVDEEIMMKELKTLG